MTLSWSKSFSGLVMFPKFFHCIWEFLIIWSKKKKNNQTEKKGKKNHEPWTMIKWPTNDLVFQHAWNPKIYTLGETQWKQKLLIKLKFAANFNSSKIYPSDEMYSPKIEKVGKIFWNQVVMSVVNSFTYYEHCLYYSCKFYY